MSEITNNFNQQAREAEKAVLGGLMLETERFDSVILKISDKDFHGKDHQLIFESMGELINENKPLDPLTVSEKLDSKNLLNKIGGKDYLISLATETPTAANLEAYAEIIRQRSVARQLMKANSEIAELINNPQGMDGYSLLDEAERKIFSLNDEANRSQSSILSMKELIPKSIDRLHQLAESGSKLLGSSTGFKAIDNKLQGLQDGDLIVVAGRPSMGKTALAMNIAENVLVENDENTGAVLVFSLEMPAESLTTRLLSGMSRLDQQDVRSGKLDNKQVTQVVEQSKRLRELPIYIDDSSLISPMELRARARRVNRQEPNGLSLIVVDYLQLMQVPGSLENRVNQISEISRSLKSLAKELNVPVLALSQLNRAVEQRTDKRPMMADLRDSGAIEQDADVILFIYRDEVYNEDSDQGNKAEIIIGKQRNGPIGKTYLTFLKQYARFEDFVPDDRLPEEGLYSKFE
ncbi:MAG: replicative DNA helicase [Gammaproteobacteria bacterium]|jgi:replicative DNA helicase|tara:strand:- start:998 stop:2389 length:1392 start_codon:yes stop_codon:yes gene_type:complete